MIAEEHWNVYNHLFKLIIKNIPPKMCATPARDGSAVAPLAGGGMRWLCFICLV